MNGLAEALISGEPSPEDAERLALYGWLVGRWRFFGRVTFPDGRKHEGEGRIQSGWVLKGRALQDVWDFPGVFFGTTLRTYDPELDAWRIQWTDPGRNYHVQQIGRAVGPEIVQEGTDQRGVLRRWTFRERSASDFRWVGEWRNSASKPWELQLDCWVSREDG